MVYTKVEDAGQLGQCFDLLLCLDLVHNVNQRRPFTPTSSIPCSPSPT